MSNAANRATQAVNQLIGFVDAHDTKRREVAGSQPDLRGINPLDAQLIAGMRAQHEIARRQELDRLDADFKRNAWASAKQAAEQVQAADRAARSHLAKTVRDKRKQLDPSAVGECRIEVRQQLDDPRNGFTVAERAQAVLNRAERADDAPAIAALRTEAMESLTAIVGNSSIGGQEGAAALDALTRLRAAVLPGEQEVAEAEAALVKVEHRQADLCDVISTVAHEAGGSPSSWTGELNVKNRRQLGLMPTPADLGGAFAPGGAEVTSSTVDLGSF
jgi:hypothetical protein